VRRSPAIVAGAVRIVIAPVSRADAAAASGPRPRDDICGGLALHGADVGRIDKREAQVGTAIPHREGGGLDERGETFERGGDAAGLCLEPLDLAPRLGDVEQPESGRAAQRFACRTALDEEYAIRAGDAEASSAVRPWLLDESSLSTAGGRLSPSQSAMRGLASILPSRATSMGMAGAPASSDAKRSAASCASRAAAARRSPYSVAPTPAISHSAITAETMAIEAVSSVTIVSRAAGRAACARF
jgi:hypothetical protein